jgi:hypothetical protein
MLFEHFAILKQLKKNNRYLIYLANNYLTIDIATIISKNYKKFYKKNQKSSILEKLKKQIYSKFKY